MNKLFILLALSLLLSPSLIAQETKESIEEKFEDILRRSNNYREYEVIKKSDIGRIRQEIADSLNSFKKSVGELRSTINERDLNIDNLNDSLQLVNTELKESRKKEDSIYLFGMLMKKTSYNYTMLGLIGLLLVLLFFFITRYRSSSDQTRSAKEKLANIEAEFEAHRQRSLEREQQIRRKLQDEINKNKENN